MNVAFETLQQDFTRRRALLIAPFAFAGLVAIYTRRGHDSELQGRTCADLPALLHQRTSLPFVPCPA